VAHVPAGDPFSHAERAALDEAVRRAEELSRVEFSVFVGNVEGESRAFATRLHNSLVAPSRSVLIMVDPTLRVLEIVTGGYVRRTLSDKQVELVALHMQADFATGDLVGGLRAGIRMLADYARPQNTLHAGA